MGKDRDHDYKSRLCRNSVLVVVDRMYSKSSNLDDVKTVVN